MVSVTDRAQQKLREVLDSNGSAEASVRVAVVRGPHGCVHGWRLAVEELADPKDTIVEAGLVHILIEPELVDILEGGSIDYREDTMGIGFTIEAPNASQMGCMHE